MNRSQTFCRTLAALGVLITAGIGRPQAQNPAPAASRERGTSVVTLDFAAASKDGRPIVDLTAADVTVQIDGKARTIRSLQLISFADVTSGAAAAAAPLPPPFGSSGASDEGRTIILALDDDSFQSGKERPLRDAVSRFLSSLTPRDRVTLITMPYGGVKVPLTTEHERIRRALSEIVGQATTDQSGSEMACRTRRTLEALGGMLRNLDSAAGPVTVMFVTSGMAGPRRDAALTMAPGMCELTADNFQAVGVAAGAARASFYVIQPDDVAARPVAASETIAGGGFRGSDNPLEGIEHIAGVTGAHRINLAGADAGALERVARETSSYYVVSIEPERGDTPGRHRGEVRVSRPDVEVWSRPELTILRTAAARPKVTAREMLAVTNVFRDLPLRAAGFVSRADGESRLKVVSLAEPYDPSVRIASAVAGLVDPNGRVVAQWSAADTADVPLIGGLLAAPGPYRLRVAATDSEGRAGTADFNLVAELVPAGPLKLSSLVLGLSRAGGFIPRLQFGTEPVALGSLEIYGGAPGQAITATLELATTLDGPALLRVPLAISHSRADCYIATGAIPIGALPPGDFIVRATVGVEGQPAGRVVRTLRKIPG